MVGLWHPRGASVSGSARPPARNRRRRPLARQPTVGGSNHPGGRVRQFTSRAPGLHHPLSPGAFSSGSHLYHSATDWRALACRLSVRRGKPGHAQACRPYEPVVRYRRWILARPPYGRPYRRRQTPSAADSVHQARLTLTRPTLGRRFHKASKNRGLRDIKPSSKAGSKSLGWIVRH